MMGDRSMMSVEARQLFEAVCFHPGCKWRQMHTEKRAAERDATEHERGWHVQPMGNEKAAAEWEAKLARILDACRKIVDGPVGGFHPTHLGGCIGVLSQPSCDCGLADLRFAMQALDDNKGEILTRRGSA